jgi:hypothetical protein
MGWLSKGLNFGTRKGVDRCARCLEACVGTREETAWADRKRYEGRGRGACGLFSRGPGYSPCFLQRTLSGMY